MTHPLTLRLPDDTYERLREQAHTERTTITALILAALEQSGAIALTADEAAHAAWAIRQAKGWPKGEPDVIGWDQYNRTLAERLEAAS